MLEANRRPKMDEASRLPARHQLVASAGVKVEPEPWDECSDDHVLVLIDIKTMPR